MEEENQPDRSNEKKGFKRPFRRRSGFRRDFRFRRMHKAVCTECKNECEVPFKPTEGKSVYCKDCFMKIKKEN